MPRSLSNRQRRNLDARRSDDPYLQLLTFKHANLSKPLRIAKNADDITSQGFVFHKGWFDLEVPSDTNEPPKGRLSIPNVDREAAAVLLRLRTPPRIRLQAVLASDPDTVIEDYDFLYLRQISGDAEVISGVIDSWNFTTEPWPARSGTEARFPGVWM